MKLLVSKLQFKYQGGKTLLHYALLNLLLAGGANAQIQNESLEANAGATDVYQLTCGSQGDLDTSYASLKLLDTTSESQASQTPQLINVELSKLGYTTLSDSLAEGSSKQFILNGGSGKYQLKIDTTGSNPAYSSQNYQVYYQCYNENDVVTSGSAIGLKPGVLVNKSIATFKSKKSKLPVSKIYKINCKKNKKVSPAESSYIKVLINNTTVHFDTSQAYLNAQITRLDVGQTINASDRPGDLEYGSEIQLAPVNNSGASVGNGNYYISVDTTANEQTVSKQKSYSFEYSCRSSDGTATAAEINHIQNQ